MKIKLTFTEEHIALIKAIDFKKIDFEEVLKSFNQYDEKVEIMQPNGMAKSYTLGDILDDYRINIDSIYGVDNFALFGGTYLWEQMAYILGLQDHVIKGTEDDPMGPKFPEEDMEYMRDLDAFIVTHLEHIFQLLIQFCTTGIQAGVTYWCYDNEHIWHIEE